MAKNIFYNLIVCVILVCFILVATYILMYDKIPTSSSNLQTKQYTRTKEVEKYLETDTQDSKDYIIKSYEVNDNDLTKLQKEKIYKEGKSNPFDEYKETTVENDSSSNTSTQTTTQNSQEDFSRNNDVVNAK